MKKVAFLVILTMLFTLASNVYATETPIKVYVDGSLLNFTTDPIQTQGTTLVQFTPVFKALGLSLAWDQKTQSITGTKKGLKIQLTINSKVALVNGVKKSLNVAPRLVNGTTVIPLRFISDATGKEIDWNPDTKVIKIGSPKTKKVSPPTSFKYHVNSADGVTLTWIVSNLSKKTIKYLTVHISTFNAVGDPSYDQITGESTFSVKFVGPVEPDAEMGMFNIFTYQGALKTVKITELDLEYTDGTKETVLYDLETSDSTGYSN